MRTFIITVVLFAVITGIAGATQTAVQAWNAHCADHDFAPYPAPAGTTFAQAYSGDNLQADLGAMEFLVSQAMGISGAIGYDDMLNATLENWESSGTR
jgi:hypothetical protein